MADPHELNRSFRKLREVLRDLIEDALTNRPVGKATATCFIRVQKSKRDLVGKRRIEEKNDFL